MDFTPAGSQQAVAVLAAEVLAAPHPWKELARAGLLDVSSLGVLDLTGPAGATAHDPALQEFLLSRCLSIAGGTTQILLSLVAERLLGLPREEAR